jgi:hypothetical protein
MITLSWWQALLMLTGAACSSYTGVMIGLAARRLMTQRRKP